MLKKEYDYLIVGSGLFGAVFAYEMLQSGKKCLVLEKRKHPGGNVRCEKIEGINVHSYGAHIFHTSDLKIWEYVNRFASFNHYVNAPLASHMGKFYNLPFNMNTFYRLWGTRTPTDAKARIDLETAPYRDIVPQNLEEQALKFVGPEIYEKFIRHYTEKQWGRKSSELPASIIKRIPLRYNYDNNYFNDRYQGIPHGGYNGLIEKLLTGTQVRTDTDFFADRSFFESLARKVVFTGKLDEYHNYRFGDLEYRSLRFETQVLESENFQGNAVINYTDNSESFTRIYEHKHFEFGTQPYTVISKEFPQPSAKHNEPYYPINDLINSDILKKYKKLTGPSDNVIFGGRLAEYRYYDMHQVIGSALVAAGKEVHKIA